MAEQLTYEVSEIEQERAEFRRMENLCSHLTSVVSSLLFVVLVVVVLKNSPGWPRVKESFFSPEYFAQAWPKVLEGLWLNIRVLGVALVGVAILGTSLALVRMTTSAVMFPLRVVARFYTTIMRGIPMIVVLYLIGFGIPGQGLFGRIDKADLGTIAVVMSYSPPTSPRCCVRASRTCIPPSAPRRARWASRRPRPCAWSSSRRACARLRPPS